MTSAPIPNIDLNMPEKFIFEIKYCHIIFRPTVLQHIYTWKNSADENFELVCDKNKLHGYQYNGLSNSNG